MVKNEATFFSLALDQSSHSFIFDKVILSQDISISGVSSRPPFGSELGGCVPFKGTFDGQGHTLHIQMTGESAALFCGLKDAVVKNLVISSSSLFSGTSESASAISLNEFGNVTFCSVINRAKVQGKKSAGAFVADVVDIGDSFLTVNNAQTKQAYLFMVMTRIYLLLVALLELFLIRQSYLSISYKVSAKNH